MGASSEGQAGHTQPEPAHTECVLQGAALGCDWCSREPRRLRRVQAPLLRAAKRVRATHTTETNYLQLGNKWPTNSQRITPQTDKKQERNPGASGADLRMILNCKRE